jgi:integrase
MHPHSSEADWLTPTVEVKPGPATGDDHSLCHSAEGAWKASGLAFAAGRAVARRWRPRLGLRTRLHDLRHFMVAQLVAGGVDWGTASGRVGHADGHMTLATYARFPQDQDRQAAELMERLIRFPEAGAGR